MRIRGKYRLNRRSIRKLICALMCAIAVYLTKGASYDPQEAELCRQEICHLELICAALPEDTSYAEVPPFEYHTLKKYFLKNRRLTKDVSAAAVERSTSADPRKSFSRFAQIGAVYKGVGIIDPWHIMLFGTRIEVTSAYMWRRIDSWMEAHFNDKMFSVTRNDFLNMTSGQLRMLKKFIHRQTRLEANLTKIRNDKYTGLAWFEDPKIQMKVN